MQKIYPLTPVQGGSGPIEFHIQGNADDYLDMDNTFLCLRVRVKRPDGTVLDGADRVYPTNNWMHTLFSDVSCSMNGTQIEGGAHLYPYKAYLTNLLLYGREAKRCQLQLSGFAKDEAGKMVDPTSDALNTRHSWIAESRVCDLVGPLTLDICQQGRLILNQVDVRIKLTRNKNEFALISLRPDGANTAALKGVVSIEEAYLKVRRVHVSSDTVRQHEGTLQLQNALYPYQRTEMQTYTISAGTHSHIKDNLFAGQMPKLLVMGFVHNEDFNGKYESNPFTFRHKKVNHIGLFKDGQPIPHAPLTPNFPLSLYGEEYMNLMDALDLATVDGDIDITRNDFGNGYALFAFNLSPDKVVAGHGQPLRDGNLRIELKFGDALAVPINVVLMAIFDGQLEISRLRKVTLEG